MKRDDAIQKVLLVTSVAQLAATVSSKVTVYPKNYTLQLLYFTAGAASDTQNNWFTALAILCIYQRDFCKRLLQEANIASGHPPLTYKKRAELVEAIASGAKLTKADAG